MPFLVGANVELEERGEVVVLVCTYQCRSRIIQLRKLRESFVVANILECQTLTMLIGIQHSRLSNQLLIRTLSCFYKYSRARPRLIYGLNIHRLMKRCVFDCQGSRKVK